MKDKLFLLCLGLFVSVVFSFSQENNILPKDSLMDDPLNQLIQKANELEGTPYPFKTIISEKSGTSLDELNKKIIYLHTWFASCSPCIAEFKPLNEMYLKFKNNDNFEIISLTFENEKTISDFKKKYGIGYRIIHVTEDECRKLNLISGFPTNILLKRNMTIQKIYVGGLGSDEKTNSFFKETVSNDVEKLLK